MNKLIVEAIRAKKLLQFDYEGNTRLVEPHCFGVSKANHYVLRAYQVGGFSNSGTLKWRMFLTSNMKNLQTLNEHFDVRSDYKYPDKDIRSVLAHL